MKILIIPCLIVLTFSINAQNLNNGLIAHYPFDGNANDSGPNAHHGTLNGPTAANDRFNNPNSAYYFDGSNDEININNSATLNPTAGISICAWYKAEEFAGAGYSPIFTKGFTSHTSPYYQYKLGVMGSNNGKKFAFSVTTNNFENRVTANDNSWIAGNWYFVVGTYDGAQLKLYINNSLVASTVATGAISTYSSNIRFGNNTTLPDRLRGTIDDTRLYDRALTTQEIDLLYSNATGVKDVYMHQDGLSLYPNPAENYLVIDCSIIGIPVLKVEIYDLTGKKVYDNNQASTEHSIKVDLSAFHKGIYIVKAITNSRYYSEKLVLK